MIPNYLSINWLTISQTLLTALITTWLFVIVVLLYNLFKKNKSENIFTFLIDSWLEMLQDFIDETWWHIPWYAKKIALFLFVYIFRNNLLWVFGDMFAYVVPTIHHYFRPATTDVFFNAIMAMLSVFGALVYWIHHGWIKYLEKYFPIHWLWIVKKVDSIWTFFGKIMDIFVWFFVWFIELIWEFAKLMSLSLRLFWNVFAWMVLLGLSITWATAIFKFTWIDAPFLLPILTLVVELFVWFLQAFIFTLLTLVYFKIAWTSHH